MNTSEGRWETGKGTGEARGLQENLGVAPRDDECESGGDNSELQRGIEKRRGRRERERDFGPRKWLQPRGWYRASIERMGGGCYEN